MLDLKSCGINICAGADPTGGIAQILGVAKALWDRRTLRAGFAPAEMVGNTAEW